MKLQRGSRTILGTGRGAIRILFWLANWLQFVYVVNARVLSLKTMD